MGTAIVAMLGTILFMVFLEEGKWVSMLVVLGIVLLCALGFAIERDEWKAHRNRTEYWKNGGPDQYRNNRRQTK